MNLDMFYEVPEQVDGAVTIPEPVLKPRPETKSLDDVVQVIKHNPVNDEVINRFIQMYATGLQWDWFEAHQQWSLYKLAHEEYLASLPVVLPDDEEAPEPPQFNEPEPVRPEVQDVAYYRSTLLIDGLTIDEWIFRFHRSIEVKRITVEVDGLLFDGDEDSQRRMLSALVAADTLGLDSTVWRLADNTVQEVTRAQLTQAHAKSILAQGALWIPPNTLPTK